MPIANSYDATWFLTLILRSLNYGSIKRVCYLWSANISMQSIRATAWELHLQAVSEMLPYLAASGHNNYTKSALIYLK